MTTSAFTNMSRVSIKFLYKFIKKNPLKLQITRYVTGVHFIALNIKVVMCNRIIGPFFFVVVIIFACCDTIAIYQNDGAYSLDSGEIFPVRVG